MTAVIKITHVRLEHDRANDVFIHTVFDANADKINALLKDKGFCYGFTDEDLEHATNLEAWKPNSYDTAKIRLIEE